MTKERTIAWNEPPKDVIALIEMFAMMRGPLDQSCHAVEVVRFAINSAAPQTPDMAAALR